MYRTTHDTFALYRLAVSQTLRGQRDGVISNRSIDQAIIVVEEAFYAARYQVRILAHQLPAYIYAADTVVSAVEAFLRRPNTRLAILTEPAAATADRNLWNFLRVLYQRSDQISIEHLPVEASANYNSDFLLVDDVSFKYQNDYRSPYWSAVAGGPKVAETFQNLASIFDELMNQAVLFERATSNPLLRTDRN